jgi:hypothetical protein
VGVFSLLCSLTQDTPRGIKLTFRRKSAICAPENLSPQFMISLTRKGREYFELLIFPKTNRKQSHTVLSKRMPGKTMVLMTLILVWADGSLCQDRFSYVFYF